MDTIFKGWEIPLVPVINGCSVQTSRKVEVEVITPLERRVLAIKCRTLGGESGPWWYVLDKGKGKAWMADGTEGSSIDKNTHGEQQ